jgi:hypothetical protein
MRICPELSPSDTIRPLAKIDFFVDLGNSSSSSMSDLIVHVVSVLTFTQARSGYLNYE